MNLEGKIVKVIVPEGDRRSNNYQKSCPGIVTADWCPDADNSEGKSLNLRVIKDGADNPEWVTSVMHVSYKPEEGDSGCFYWEMYE